MAQPTLCVDRSGTILSWSADAEEMLGYSRAEALGQSIEIIIPAHLRAQHNSGFQRYVRTGESALPETVTTSAQRKGGTIVRLQISVSAVRGAAGAIIAVEARMRR
ncbi:MAG: PAS domain S-box protein [Hyphomicrobiales bacterium]|nr:PAS domain S-box protein [Hyphomicrobiales bacterium]